MKFSEIKTSQKRVIVFGASAGGIKALRKLLELLPDDLPFIMAGVLHISNDYLDGSASGVDPELKRVKEAVDKIRPETGRLYLAPAGYHLLLEEDGSLSLDVSPEVNYSRPSIDVLFESAANAFGREVVGVLLTGAGLDGAKGLSSIKDYGGLTVVQDPEDADYDFMPKAAISRRKPDYTLTLEEIPTFLNAIAEGPKGGER